MTHGDAGTIWGDVPTWCAAVGACVAFGIGLWQYKKSQDWKKAEFLAAEMKEFFANPRVAVALTMIDWGGREVGLPIANSPGGTKQIYVDYPMQTFALRPHTLPSKMVSSRGEATGKTRDGSVGFEPEHAAIRDCYDALFDGLERFGGYVKSELVGVEDLRPYLEYWITDIYAPAADAEVAAWNAMLLTYIHVYSFRNVVYLFKSFGKPIGWDQDVYAGFLKQMQDQDLALALLDAAKEASTS